MSRVEENRKLINDICEWDEREREKTTQVLSFYEQMQCRQFISISAVLKDISISLAVIADNIGGEKNETDD